MPVKEILQRAYDSVEKGNYKRATYLSRQAVDENPESANAHGFLGNLLNIQEQYVEAEEHLRQAIDIDPEDANYHGCLGKILAGQEQYMEAEDHLRQALDINPEDAGVHDSLGAILLLQERYKEAEDHLRQALNINPEFAHAHFHLGKLLLQQDQYEEAEDQFRQALNINPEDDPVNRILVELDADLYFHLGKLLEQQERYEAAEDHYRKAIDANPNFAEAEDRLTKLVKRIKTHPTSGDTPFVPDFSVNYEALTDEEPIGGGGNADVSKAVLQTSEGEMTLAIKRPRMDGTLHTDAVDRMLTEAETWNKLDDHDHIVGVVDYSSTPVPWIAMEYMDSGHLGTYTGEMDIQQALWTALAVTKGVRHAHRQGVAHLDLKPANILFKSVEDAWDVPKVADWGLSKHLLEHSKSVEGISVEYAAPEQFDDDYGSTDDITDVYQLGAVFYELFTGRPPYEGQPFKIIDKVKSEQPTPPSELTDLPDGLDEILLKALQKEKDERYESVLLLRNDLQELFDSLD